VQSQRPWYAGSANRLPVVLPQYVDERIAAERTSQAGQAGQAPQTGQAGQTAQAPSTGQAGQAGQAPSTGQAGQAPPTGQAGQVAQRGQTGQTGQASQAGQAEQGLSFPWNLIDSTTQVPGSVTMKLPVDAAGDASLINRIKTWPRDKQPFWFLNSQAIQAHRGDVNNPAQPS